MNRYRFLQLVCLLIFLAASAHAGDRLPEEMTSEAFRLKCDASQGGLSHLGANSPAAINFLMQGQTLGAVETSVRADGGDWHAAGTAASEDVRQCHLSPDGRSFTVDYGKPSQKADGIKEFTLSETFQLLNRKLLWKLCLQNSTEKPLEIGELGLPMVFAQNYDDNPNITYKQRVLRHSLTCGDHAFIFWMLPSGEGPYLLMTPRPGVPGAPGTRLEYARRTPRPWWGEGLWTPYIHAKAAAARFGDADHWRQRLTSVVLSPHRQPGDTVEYAFTFQWVPDFSGVREALVCEGLLDVQVAPGMTVPRDLAALVAIRCRGKIGRLTPEFPDETTIEDLGPREDYQRYRIHFRRLGENKLAVNYGNGKSAELEFFCTESLAKLVKKRAAFVARNQVRDPHKWYDGLFAEWDMHLHQAATPDNPGGLPKFAACGADDPGLCRAPMIAAKNAAFPERAEIEALEYYIRNFLWGKLQRTDREDPSYAILGSDSWLENRNSPQQRNCGGVGGERMWRTFDYTHIILLYYNMYRIARDYPDKVKYLDRQCYLQRAYGTARAFFSVPYNINMGPAWHFRGWCDWAYKQGNFDESCIPPLIDALREEGCRAGAEWLEAEWTKKVKFFLYDSEFPFGSEMPFDTTAFESTHVIAKWALAHPLQPDDKLWYDKNLNKWYSHPRIDPRRPQAFLDRQILGNIASRGWLETAYWTLGSDLPDGGNTRYMLRYMAPLGGWAVMDYGLYHATQPADYLRLGYASLLASWALMNSGDEASGYGYWYPGRANDGASGWAYNAVKTPDGDQGLYSPSGRGAWHYDGEADNGYGGYIRYAATVLADDPIFGFMAYGGEAKAVDGSMEVIPRDGLRQRFHAIVGPARLHLAMQRDGFAAEQPIVLIAQTGDKAISVVRFALENRSEEPHAARLAVGGLAPGKCRLLVDGREHAQWEQRGSENKVIDLPAGRKQARTIEIRRAVDH